nr:MAG TPA: hypothetical protein [Caudoviricetes sp.]
MLWHTSMLFLQCLYFTIVFNSIQSRTIVLIL